MHARLGGDQRRLVFDGAAASAYGEPGQLSYWLDLWIDAYDYLMQQADALGDQLVFFCYERFTDAPEETRAQLLTRLDLDSTAALEVRERPEDNNDPPPLARLNDARQLYQIMTDRGRAALS